MTPSHSGPSDRLEASLAGFDVPAAPHQTSDRRRVVPSTTPNRSMLLACNASGVLVASLSPPMPPKAATACGRKPAGAASRSRWTSSTLAGELPREAAPGPPRVERSRSRPVPDPGPHDPRRPRRIRRSRDGQLASWAGRPQATRANRHRARQPAVRRAPLPPVVGASGSLTGYAGGLAAKRYLLELESTSL
jgi:hypothetical protein